MLPVLPPSVTLPGKMAPHRGISLNAFYAASVAPTISSVDIDIVPPPLTLADVFQQVCDQVAQDEPTSMEIDEAKKEEPAKESREPLPIVTGHEDDQSDPLHPSHFGPTFDFDSFPTTMAIEPPLPSPRLPLPPTPTSLRSPSLPLPPIPDVPSRPATSHYSDSRRPSTASSVPLSPNLSGSSLRDTPMSSPPPSRRPSTAGASTSARTSFSSTPPDSLLQRANSLSSHSSGSIASRRASIAEWTPPAVDISPTSPMPRLLSLQTTTEMPVSDIPKELQKMFDQATRMLHKSLELSLVYLVSLDLSAATPSLRLLSSCGLPTPPPSFDPQLHLKALRAAEGGLLFKSPLSTEERRLAGGPGYASGLLLPILEVRRRGFVLGGYTDDGERELGDKELTYFVRFAEQLEMYVMKVGK
ncbi:GAF domain containing protein [Pseudohyphozyma bogoriensis]|nr:GAF domain containing protein [Pseudohyphozyma bogoriensis]